MPHTPPINLKQLKARGMLDEERFYHDVATEAGVADVDTVKKIYGAMVRVITRRLLDNFGTRMPYLGDFGMPLFRSKTARMGTQTVKLPPRRTLKFYPKNTWTQHLAAKLGYRDY